MAAPNLLMIWTVVVLFILRAVDAAVTVIPLRISVLPQLPYVICDAPLVNNTCPGLWYGFAIDMVDAMIDSANAANASVQYQPTYYRVPDGAFGSKQASGEWSGLIGELTTGAADIVAAAITITPARGQVVSFTVPFMSAPYAMLIRTPKPVPNPWSFTQPFNGTLWGWVMLTVVLFAVMLLVYERFSPFGLRYNPLVSDAEKRSWNASEAVSTAVGALFGSVNGSALAWSTRILLFSMYFFSLIIVANYTANLTAFAAVKQFAAPVGSIEQISRDRLPVAVIGNSSTSSWIINNADPSLRRIQTFWTLVKDYDAAIAALRSGAVDVVFGSLPSLRYFAIVQPCDLSIVGETAAFGFFGVGLQRNSALFPTFDYHLGKVVESGYLATLDGQYFRDQCAQETAVSATVLTFQDMSGVFLTLLMFVAAATVSLCLEQLAFANRFRAGPCKIWRRLNICCGYHYAPDKTFGPPRLNALTKQWAGGMALSLRQLSRKKAVAAASALHTAVPASEWDASRPPIVAELEPDANDSQLASPECVTLSPLRAYSIPPPPPPAADDDRQSFGPLTSHPPPRASQYYRSVNQA